MKYFFIGIGGISMSALAQLLKAQGEEVSGYDAVQSLVTDELEREGIHITFDDDLKDIENADIVVQSSAISNEDIRLNYARSLGKRILTRGQLLGQIAKQYENVIAIAGAHGKTTTTGLIASIFDAAGLNPTVHIGGLLQAENTNLIIGEKKFFITEACEYKDNFLNLFPTFGVVLNVEAEHLDYFKTFENVKKSFRKFISQSQYFIAPPEFSSVESPLSFKNYSETILGMKFECLKNDKHYLNVESNLHGLHNIQNILIAISVAEHFNISKKDICEGIKKFKGVKRRFEKHKFKNGGALIFDYAHHPTEIASTISTVKKICEGRLIVLFQPHTYSRTKLLFDDFLKSLNLADEIIIFKTYSARERYDADGDAKRLFEALKTKKSCSYSDDYGILDTLANVTEKDVVLVLGAGDFYDKWERKIFQD